MDRGQTIQAIEASLSSIAKNGTLVCRKDSGRAPSWSLRFRDVSSAGAARKHRRINLGDDAQLIELVRQAIGCRKRKHAEKHETDAARADEAKRLRAMEAQLMEGTKGSRRYRQGVRKAFWEFCAATPKPDSDEVRAYIDGLALSRRSPGRPLKSRLW